MSTECYRKNIEGVQNEEYTPFCINAFSLEVVSFALLNSGKA